MNSDYLDKLAKVLPGSHENFSLRKHPLLGPSKLLQRPYPQLEFIRNFELLELRLVEFSDRGTPINQY